MEPHARKARNQPLAAVGRFRRVIDTYQTTSHTPEALFRLVEAYLTLGLVQEAERNELLNGLSQQDCQATDNEKSHADQHHRATATPI